jgi:uroporphyrin-3 C-methyltransferase
VSPNDALPEPAAPVPPAVPPTSSATAAAPVAASPSRGWVAALAAALLAGAGGLYFGWSAQQRVGLLEQELVRRQQASEVAATEARVLADRAQDAARDAVARVSLLDARVAEAALQRTQVEQLLHQMARSRDDQVLADVDVALRLAVRHGKLLGSAEPVITALRQADERLALIDPLRAQRVREAVARDLVRLGDVRVADVALLAVRVDELLRQVDELPMVALADPRQVAAPAPPGDAAAAPPPDPQPLPPDAGWLAWVGAVARDIGWRVWIEARALLRVTPVDHPEALLLTPEQSHFVREGLRLRLLSARLALLARQFDLVQTDIAAASALIERYFDAESLRVQAARTALADISRQARAGELPNPDETLAALAALPR